MAKRYYELEVAGVKRSLPVINISDSLAIAGFVILGDTEIVEKTAAELAKKVPADTDILMAAETKGIPLVQAMARILGMPRYIVARKSIKAIWNILWWWRTNPSPLRASRCSASRMRTLNGSGATR